MARPIKIKESDLTNMVKRIIAEKGLNEGPYCKGGCPENHTCTWHGCKPNFTVDGVDKTHAGSDYEGIDHKDRSKFDGRKSKVIGVDSDIEDQRFEKNMKEGYRKYGCKFLQSRKSLNEDKLTNLFETDRDIREQNILSKKLRFIESAIKHTKCGTILREQKETTPNNRNDYRRTRKLIYENMDWEAVRRNNNRRLRK